MDISLVTKLTKHVSKVRETVKKCEKHVEITAKRFLWRQTRKNDIAIFGFLFLYKIPDFTTRLVPWPGDKNSPFSQKVSKKLSFWTLHFSFVWKFTDFSRLCNLYAYLVDKIFLCFVKKPIFFRTFTFPITRENRTFRKKQNRILINKAYLNGTRVQKNKEYSRKREPRLQNNNFGGGCGGWVGVCGAKFRESAHILAFSDHFHHFWCTFCTFCGHAEMKRKLTTR